MNKRLPRWSLSPIVFACAIACTSIGCDKPRFTESDTTVVVDGKRRDVHETVRVTGRGGEQVQRNIKLVDEPKDTVLELAELDARGFATAASFRREGPKGKRYVELRDQAMFSRGNDEVVAFDKTKPIVLWSLRHRVKPLAGDGTPAPPALDVVVIDIEHAVARDGTVDAKGAVTLAPARAATASDPVRPDHTQATPFLESTAPQIASWCKMQAAGAAAQNAAVSLAQAARPKIAADRDGGPPAALNAVAIGGGADAGAALVVACLRALGHPARIVSTNDKTWGEVHDGTTWTPVDLDGATAGTIDQQRVEGFRGAFAP